MLVCVCVHLKGIVIYLEAFSSQLVPSVFACVHVVLEAPSPPFVLTKQMTWNASPLLPCSVNSLFLPMHPLILNSPLQLDFPTDCFTISYSAIHFVFCLIRSIRSSNSTAILFCFTLVGQPSCRRLKDIYSAERSTNNTKPSA